MANESTISASSISISTLSMLPETTFVPECNPGQQYQYTDPSSGNPYVVQCNQTYQGIVGLATYESSPEDCISACSANPQCLGVGYDTSDGECDEYYGNEDDHDTNIHALRFSIGRNNCFAFGFSVQQHNGA
ncbi:hypothetical protein KC343_g4286 [Hortaea werneckii]|nr:hypothetical protein KC352_g10675 [Hortaea werneckii]KAI7568042.1 hypothetical protein KC317_g4544 [Hortaea werneckii]KAI7620309.1 hypothetical protein KC346_g4183 [Hortaea werneckii]KAI7631023.1 hypothetical protein KC343_g4286 [Hortaea werneckii]KAI7673674.1 hypothetical protein KC319_g4982 [Hortaea werneckii]